MKRMVVVQTTRVMWSPNLKPKTFPDGDYKKGGDGHPLFMLIFM
jgi:hypothetical protein